ncbi:hypothetical protein, partial [Jatrophihabitans sp.]|uniref:hypothetical protein n=1 Tax=Jatrophihabitans sp. TaxID=1932789 RepID=UPI002EE7B360
RLAATLSLELPRTVRFDRLSLWQTAGSDASRWRLVADRQLPISRNRRRTSSPVAGPAGQRRERRRVMDV